MSERSDIRRALDAAAERPGELVRIFVSGGNSIWAQCGTIPLSAAWSPTIGYHPRDTGKPQPPPSRGGSGAKKVSNAAGFSRPKSQQNETVPQRKDAP